MRADVFIEAMIHAARLARQASSVDGLAVVEVLWTEEGVIARGRCRKCATSPVMAKSCEIRWREALNNPALIVSSTRLVVAGLGLSAQ